MSSVKNINVLNYFLLFFCSIFLNGCGQGDESAFLAAVAVNSLNVTSIEVISDSDRVSLTEDEQFTVLAGINGEEPTLDVSDKVTWSTSNADVVTISSLGIATGVKNGSVEVIAHWSDFSDSKTLLSSNALLETVTIINGFSTVGACTDGQQLIAMGQYENEEGQYPITDKVSWRSDNTLVVAVGNEDLGDGSNNDKGIISTFSGGSASITASHISGIDSIATNITADASALTSISLTPANQVVTVGSTQQFAAIGIYSDGSSDDITNTVTWASGVDDADSANVLSVDADTARGLATGVAVGSENIIAGCDVSGRDATSVSLSVTVEEAVTVTGVLIIDGDVGDENLITVELNDGEVQLTAILLMSDGSDGADVTEDDDTVWSVLTEIEGESAAVSNEDESKGLVTYTAAGRTEIRVRYQSSDFADTIDVKVE
jgi:hypothetical protein